MVGGGYVYATKGREEPPYLRGVLGGSTFGIQGAAGVADVRLAVEGEVAFHGEFSARQRTRTHAFNTHHRDVLFSGLLRFNPQGPVRPLVGVTVVAGRQHYSNAFELDVFGNAGDSLQLDPEQRDYVGPTIGIDFFGRRRGPLQLGVTTRVTWLTMRTTIPDGPSSGLGSSIVRIGAAVKFGG
jgi:hypothetical protein